MGRNLFCALFLLKCLFGLSAARHVDMIFENSEGKEVRLGEIRLEERRSNPGCCKELPAFSCLSIKTSGHDRGDGLYWINAGRQDAFQAYCDMTSFGGGWTMCYSTNNKAKPKTETTYDENAPYPRNGYRTDCNNIPFDEIMFVDEEKPSRAYFKRSSGGKIKASASYDAQANTYGLWESESLASSSYKYQLLICNHSFYSGFMVTGYTNCWKRCHSWCGDTKSPYFRTSSTSSSYPGCAFNVNGHNPNRPPAKLLSVGLR